MAAGGHDDPVAGESLRSLIRMARDEFDEEPAPRIDALLMAAARQHAPAPKLGWMARLRRWLGASMLNPALAGATALIVVGGTAGVLYLRDPQRIAEPTVSPARPAREAAPAVVAEAPELPAPGSARADVAKELAPPAPEPPPPRPKPDPRPRGGVATAMTADEAPPPPPRGPEPPPPVELADGKLDDLSIEEISGERRMQTSAGLGVAQETAVTGTRAAPSNREQAANLLRQARTAARAKNCSPVKAMAQKARKLDATYYDANFRRDPDVKNCLPERAPASD